MSYRSATGASSWCYWVFQTIAPGALGPANGFCFEYSDDDPQLRVHISKPSWKIVIGADEVTLKDMIFHLFGDT
jgi:hypothetical protein